jgi:hypothetical protein
MRMKYELKEEYYWKHEKLSGFAAAIPLPPS